jgi:hypothetical protein
LEHGCADSKLYAAKVKEKNGFGAENFCACMAKTTEAHIFYKVCRVFFAFSKLNSFQNKLFKIKLHKQTCFERAFALSARSLHLRFIRLRIIGVTGYMVTGYKVTGYKVTWLALCLQKTLSACVRL